MTEPVSKTTGTGAFAARPCYRADDSRWPDGYTRWWVWMPRIDAERIVERMQACGEDAFVEYRPNSQTPATETDPVRSALRAVLGRREYEIAALMAREKRLLEIIRVYNPDDAVFDHKKETRRVG